ncbi:hypothetical protein Pmani_019859 [Petrolisthes manimaculis]|uniref:Uncharacterized protein n=1 Tax=Petrolisthes manimaculis TaxID=1843537 RepID=A0AAE1PI30_9EUCA|nr:hypothetical protein Pmani_019859 [Petrolisthes manimaculis]
MAIDNIDAAWKEVTENTLNSTWKKLWPECVKTGFDFTGFDDMGTIRKDIVRLFHLAGFKEVDEDDVQELLQSHSEPLSNEDLMQLDQHRALQGDNDDDDDNAPQRGLDIKTLLSQASPSTSAGPASRAAPSTSADEDCDSPPSPHSVHLSCSDSPTSDDE